MFPRTGLNTQKLNEYVKGKTILITGASFGIGACLANMLGTVGATIILVGRTEERLVSVQKEIIKNAGNAEVFPVDLRNDDEIQSLIQFLKSKECLDIVINNAGKSIRRPLAESLDRYHDFSRTMAINYEAPVKLMLALLPKLSKGNGHVVNVSAMNVLMAPAPYWAAYQASKSAFDQWLRSASSEMEHMGVHVSSIYLPLVRTRMIAPTKAYEKAPAMSVDHVAKIICRSLLKKKRTFKPWWSIFGEMGSVLFRRTWERSMRRQIRKKSH